MFNHFRKRKHRKLKSETNEIGFLQELEEMEWNS